MTGRSAAVSLFSPASLLERSRVAAVLRAETTGGLLLLAGAMTALVWANAPGSSSYAALRDWSVGPAALHLHLSLGAWASEGLLALFFFVAGLEVKREFVAGDLRDPRRAAVPVAAAVGGMVAPALTYLVVTAASGRGGLHGWAIPTATDIAFALAVLALIGTHLPAGLRTFLLTLAVVDDLLAIAVIALVYTDELHPVFLALALLPLLAFGALAQMHQAAAYLLVPLAATTWGLMHASGVHATVAGVLLALTVPVRGAPGLAEHLEHLLRPLSAGIAVPVFAFFAAGVTVGGWGGLRDAVTDPVAIGIVVGLLVGKSVGVGGSTYLLATFTRADLDEHLAWVDVIGLAVLTGMGFTVSLLIGELAFGSGTPRDDHVKVGVLIGSLLASMAAAVMLRSRDRHYRRAGEPGSAREG